MRQKVHRGSIKLIKFRAQGRLGPPHYDTLSKMYCIKRKQEAKATMITGLDSSLGVLPRLLVHFGLTREGTAPRIDLAPLCTPTTELWPGRIYRCLQLWQAEPCL